MLRNQAPSGAFVASPDFTQYHYCWLRDSSFIAHALDRAGESTAARRFHEWCTRAVESVLPMMELAIERHRDGKTVDPTAMPPARFDLEGRRVTDDWPNFQVDGYGSWLWSLGEHLTSSQEGLPPSWRPIVEHTAGYLWEYAFEPCFDVWEMHGDEIHTSTVAAVYAGLSAAARMLGDPSVEGRARSVREALLERARSVGWFEKSSAQHTVDASTLWVMAPFAAVDSAEPAFVATLERVEAELSDGGGVRRFPADTYFGGGMWPVLSCSLGLCHLRRGDREAAERYLSWTRERIEGGRLGEQFGGDRRDPTHYAEWLERWGTPAADLTWSHAMFVLLSVELDGSAGDGRERRPTDLSN